MSVKYGFDIDFKKNPIGSTATVILYIAAIYLIYQIIRAILGHSWDPITILFSASLLIIVNMFRIEYKLGIFMGEMREFKRTCIQNLSRINKKLFEEKNNLR